MILRLPYSVVQQLWNELLRNTRSGCFESRNPGPTPPPSSTYVSCITSCILSILSLSFLLGLFEDSVFLRPVFLFLSSFCGTTLYYVYPIVNVKCFFLLRFSSLSLVGWALIFYLVGKGHVSLGLGDFWLSFHLGSFIAVGWFMLLYFIPILGLRFIHVPAQYIWFATYLTELLLSPYFQVVLYLVVFLCCWLWFILFFSDKIGTRSE